jgi:DNA-binding MurR/RpiR family transcriptional regulator
VSASGGNGEDGEDAERGLEARIMLVADHLTPKQRQLGRFLLENQIYVGFASTQEVGQRAKVDAATVVRFSQLLGYKGFADLRNAIRNTVPAYLTAAEKVSRTLERNDQPKDVIDSVYSQDIDNIRAASRANSAADLTAAMTKLDQAREVYVIGSGLSAAVAMTFAHQLNLVGISAKTVTGNFVQGAVEVAHVAATDVVVAISLWRYVRETTALVRAASQTAASTICLTDSRLAPFAEYADVLLVGYTQSLEVPHSITSLITLCNVLTSGVALMNPTRALARLEMIEKLYAESGVAFES